jgi:hypothetical protein
MYGCETLVGGSSHYKLFQKLSFGPRRVSLNEWHFVERKEVCCLVFPRTEDLKTHSILYKVFLNKNFHKYLSYVNSFV